MAERIQMSDLSHEHAWNYFELHSNQRMTLFNFFSAFSGVVIAAIAATFQAEAKFALIGIALGLLLVLVSFISWKLDQRMSMLVKHAERLLIQQETADLTKAKLFASEAEMYDDAVSSSNIWSRPWTIGGSFRLLFLMIGIVGGLSAMFSTLRLPAFSL